MSRTKRGPRAGRAISRRPRPRGFALTVIAAALVALALPGSAVARGAPESLETEITGTPTSPRFDPEGSFRFRAPGAGPAVSFQCRLDGHDWRACESPTGPIRLGRGSSLFEVRARNPAGSVDPTPASARVRRARAQGRVRSQCRGPQARCGSLRRGGGESQGPVRRRDPRRRAGGPRDHRATAEQVLEPARSRRCGA